MIGFAAIFTDKFHAVVIHGQFGDKDNQFLALTENLFQEAECSVQLAGCGSNCVFSSLYLTLEAAADAICGDIRGGD